MHKRCIALAFALLHIGCVGGIGWVYYKALSGGYGLQATDIDAQMCILKTDSEGGGYTQVIEATVYAAGWDEQYVIAKQHPHPELSLPIDKAHTKFYIIVVHSGAVVGPLSEPEFAIQRTRLGVPSSLSFSLVFSEFE